MTKLITNFKQNMNIFYWATLSGILIGTSYIPFPAWAVGFCYLPLWYGLTQLQEKNSLLPLKNQLVQHFFYAWWMQFLLSLIGFNWIAYTAHEFGHLPWAVSVIALLLFATFMHLYFPLAAALSHFLKRRFSLNTNQYLIVHALTLALLERIWPSIFEWNLGYTLFWMKWPIFQIADTIGFYGLSSLIMLFQAFLLIAFIQFKNEKKMALAIIGLLFISVVSLSYVGISKAKKWTSTNQSISIAVTQANISNEEKLASELGADFQPVVVNKYLNLVDFYLQNKTQKPQIIIWPETALPISLDPVYLQRNLQTKILSKVNEWNIPLITGAYSQDLFQKNSQNQIMIRNAVFFLQPNSFQIKPYFKSQLLAFGEYLPFGEQFPFLYNLFPFVGNYQRGPGPTQQVITLANNQTIALGPQICYESLDPGFSRGLANKNVDLIFNVTNDSWYGDWSEPYQHLTMNLARAIEVRRPLIRATNTGFSSAVLANGTILARSKMNTEWMHTFEIKYISSAEKSFYTKWGHYDWIILFIVLIGLLLIRFKQSESHEKK